MSLQEEAFGASDKPPAAEEQIDFAAEGLLDGLEGVQRAERLALLRYLAADGVPLSDLQRATSTGTLDVSSRRARDRRARSLLGT